MLTPNSAHVERRYSSPLEIAALVVEPTAPVSSPCSPLIVHCTSTLRNPHCARVVDFIT